MKQCEVSVNYYIVITLLGQLIGAVQVISKLRCSEAVKGFLKITTLH